jgi:hypothetical protein
MTGLIAAFRNGLVMDELPAWSPTAPTSGKQDARPEIPAPRTPPPAADHQLIDLSGPSAHLPAWVS